MDAVCFFVAIARIAGWVGFALLINSIATSNWIEGVVKGKDEMFGLFRNQICEGKTQT